MKKNEIFCLIEAPCDMVKGSSCKVSCYISLHFVWYGFIKTSHCMYWYNKVEAFNFSKIGTKSSFIRRREMLTNKMNSSLLAVMPLDFMRLILQMPVYHRSCYPASSELRDCQPLVKEFLKIKKNLKIILAV